MVLSPDPVVLYPRPLSPRKVVVIEWLKRIFGRIQLFCVTWFVTVLVSLNSFFKRQRMSHENGITARGRLRMLDDPRLPAHDFFRPGRELGCRVRHGSASWLDDAKLVVRSASVKFADHDFESPLDLMMNSGDVPLFWSARTFLSFMFGTILGRGKHWVPHLRKYPQSLVGGAVSVRRNPTSFTEMSYQTKTCFGFIAADGGRYYCRYRLIPWAGWDPKTETGLPDAADAASPWLQNPFADETRGRNYLKDELAERIDDAHKDARYRLQIQLRPWLEGPEPQWVSSQWPWDEETAPWIDLAEIELTEVLDYYEAMMTWFHMGHHPASLPVPKAVSLDDPHSLNHLRVKSIWARRARIWGYFVFGMPAKFPNTRDSKDWTAVPPMARPPGP